MASFDKYSNYNENTSFSSVVFGAEKPILEVELNEMQQIMNTKFHRLGKILGVGYYPLKESNCTYDSNTKIITITGGIIVAPNGLIAEIKDTTLTAKVDGNNNFIYFEVDELTASPESQLKMYGSNLGSSVPNPIVDPRIGFETSRRKVVIYSLKAGVKSKLSDVNYVGIGTLDTGVFVFEKVGVDKLRTEVVYQQDPKVKGSFSQNRKEGSTVGVNSFASGSNNVASGAQSVAFGFNNNSLGGYAFTSGTYLTAKANQFVVGYYNDESLMVEKTNSIVGTLFGVGNGTSSAKSNAFRVQSDGVVYAKGAYNATGADYAEYAEWADGNPNDEDRRGYFVTFDDEKPNMIRKANTDDVDVLGVVSANPCIIGNSDECWSGKHLFDEFGAPIYETVEEIVEVLDEETNEIKEETITVTRHAVNPNYDHTQKYVHRCDRKEWSAVGWIGVLAVREDGTCKVGGYCTWNDEGIATSAPPSRFNYRILERVSDNIVKIALK